MGERSEMRGKRKRGAEIKGGSRRRGEGGRVVGAEEKTGGHAGGRLVRKGLSVPTEESRLEGRPLGQTPLCCTLSLTSSPFGQAATKMNGMILLDACSYHMLRSLPLACLCLTARALKLYKVIA